MDEEQTRPEAATHGQRQAAYPELCTEINQLTTDLIAQVIGPDGILTKTFRQYLELYDAERNPISKEEAERFLLMALKIAMANRKMLNSKIMYSLDSGALFAAYHDRLREISRLRNKASILFQRMNAQEAEFNSQKCIYDHTQQQHYLFALDQNGTTEENQNDQTEETAEEGDAEE